MDARENKKIINSNAPIMKIYNKDDKIWGKTRFILKWKLIETIPKSDVPNFGIYKKYVLKDGKFIIDDTVRIASTYSDSTFYEYEENGNKIKKYSKTTKYNEAYFDVYDGILEEVYDGY